MEIVQTNEGKEEGEDDPSVDLEEGEEGAAIEEEEAEQEKEENEEEEEKGGLTIEGVEVGDETVRADEQPPEDVAMGQHLEAMIYEKLKELNEAGTKPPEELAKYRIEDAKKDSLNLIKELRIKFIAEDLITDELLERGKDAIEAKQIALEKFIEASEFVRVQEIEMNEAKEKVDKQYAPVLLELRRKVNAAKKTGEDVTSTKTTIRNMVASRDQKRLSVEEEFGQHLIPFKKRLEAREQSYEDAEIVFTAWRDETIITSVASFMTRQTGLAPQRIEDMYKFYIFKVKEQRDSKITTNVLLLWIDIINDVVATIVNGIGSQLQMDEAGDMFAKLEDDLYAKLANNEIPFSSVQPWVNIVLNALGELPPEDVSESTESALEEQREELEMERDDQFARKHDSIQKLNQSEAGLILLSDLTAADSKNLLCPIMIHDSPVKKFSTPPPPAMVPISQAIEGVPNSIRKITESIRECPTDPIISKGISKVPSPQPMMDALGIVSNSPPNVKMCVVCGETNESYAFIMEGKKRKKRKKKEGEGEVEQEAIEYGTPKIEWRTLGGEPTCNACYKAIIKHQKELKDKIIEDSARREAAISQTGEKRRAKREKERKEAEIRRQGLQLPKKPRKNIKPKKMVSTIPMRISPPKPSKPEKEKTPSPEHITKKTKVKTPPKAVTSPSVIQAPSRVVTTTVVPTAPIVIDLSPSPEKPKKSTKPPTDEEMAERIRAFKLKQKKDVMDLTATCGMGDVKRKEKK